MAWAPPEEDDCDDDTPLPAELVPEVPERDDDDVAAGVGVPAWPDVPELLAPAWLEPGSTAASAPVAAALVMPIAVVSADSRRRARRLRVPGVS